MSANRFPTTHQLLMQAMVVPLIVGAAVQGFPEHPVIARVSPRLQEAPTEKEIRQQHYDKKDNFYRRYEDHSHSKLRHNVQQPAPRGHR